MSSDLGEGNNLCSCAVVDAQAAALHPAHAFLARAAPPPFQQCEALMLVGLPGAAPRVPWAVPGRSRRRSAAPTSAVPPSCCLSAKACCLMAARRQGNLHHIHPQPPPAAGGPDCLTSGRVQQDDLHLGEMAPGQQGAARRPGRRSMPAPTRSGAT